MPGQILGVLGTLLVVVVVARHGPVHGGQARPLPAAGPRAVAGAVLVDEVCAGRPPQPRVLQVILKNRLLSINFACLIKKNHYKVLC